MRAHQPDSTALCDALDRWLAGQPNLRVIAVFAALPGEVDLAPFIARHPDLCWIYPRVAGDSLVFYAVENPATQLVAGTLGIREPAPFLTKIPTDQIDAFLCPGLAFDAGGGRLGRGRGYYDRMLAAGRPGAQQVGVCFSYQKVADTFAQTHDVPMDLVISG